MNTVDSRRQLPRWGCNRSQGSTDHNACSHCLSVGAESEVPMILSPKEGLRHSYRSIHIKRSAKWRWDHPAGRLQKYRTVGASLLRGYCGAGAALPRAAPRRPRVVYVAPVRLFWGVCGFPPRGDCVACGQGATRPGVVCVPVRAWVGGLCGVPVDGWVAVRQPFLRLRWRLRGGSSCVICGGRVWGAVLGSQSGRRLVSGAS